MKSRVTEIIVASAVVVGLAICIITAYPLESAQDKLYRQIDEKVDLAQRMLLAYRPTATHLNMRLGPAATQPADVPAEQWQNNLTQAGEGPGGTQLSDRAGQVRTINERAGQLDGEPAQPIPQPSSGREAYQLIQTELQQNDQLLADALRIVQEAIALNEGEYTGADHPAATRLEAVLCYHRADQFRCKAALYHAEADEARARFARDVTWWHRLEADIASTQLELGKTPGPTTTSAPAMAESVPSSEPAMAQTEPAASEPAAAENVQPALPPIDERIAALQARRTQTQAAVEAAQAQADQLTAAINQLKERIAVVSQQAKDAEQEMLKLQQAGLDPTDPQALQKFTEAYEKAAAANRAAYREATIIEQGAIRNARVNTTDEDEVLTRPLGPASAGAEMTTERGLVALEADLRAAQAVIDGQQAVVREIDRQVAELTTRKKEMESRVATLQGTRAGLGEQVTGSAAAALAATIEALTLEQEGIKMARERGKLAADRAKRAIDKRIADAQASESPDSPNQRLRLIHRDTAGPGHALALLGDLELMTAQIHAQQAENLLNHERLLDELERIGLPVDQNLLPPGVTPASAPPAAVKTKAARAAAELARTSAIEAAKAALEAYSQADAHLQQLWVLHANMATVHHLLANLTTGKQSVQHAEQARIEYLRAMKGREERPEIPSLQRAMASLTTQPGR